MFELWHFTAMSALWSARWIGVHLDTIVIVLCFGRYYLLMLTDTGGGCVVCPYCISVCSGSLSDGTGIQLRVCMLMFGVCVVA